jgi:hypothetical protein
VSDFESWHRALLEADHVARWALNRDAAREVFESLAPSEPEAARPRSPRIPCRVWRDNGIETLKRLDLHGERMLHGIASTPAISRNKRSFRPEGCRARIPVPLLSAHHELGHIGQVTLVRKTPVHVYVQAVFDDTRAGRYAWDLFARGELRALSVGTHEICKTVVDGIEFHDEWHLREVSLSRRGANPDAYCEPYP